MKFLPIAILLLLIPLATLESNPFYAGNALFQCGIRKRFGVQLIHHGRSAELGQWPWHAALYHGADYKCGGTLIDQRHVLSSAHCVVRRNGATLDVRELVVHLGKRELLEDSEQIHVVNVGEIHVHLEFSPNRHDVALIVLDRVVRFSEFVIPICLEKGRVGEGLGEELVGQRGWVAGWGETENGTVSGMLKTASMPVVSNTECVQSDPGLFGRFVSTAMFCASDRNGTSVCRGDSGGGMYFDVGDHWELRGIASFSGLSETGSCDTQKYVVFTNVVYYYAWIRKLTSGEEVADRPKRISERKCQQYAKLAVRQSNGVCNNARSPQTVVLVYDNNNFYCSSILISERFILTAAHCVRAPNVEQLVKVRVTSQLDIAIVRVFIHPAFNRRSKNPIAHDIALVELAQPIKLTSRLLPACLANKANENLYDTLLQTGFTGAQFYENANNRVISIGQCNLRLEDIARFDMTENNVCATGQLDSADLDEEYDLTSLSGGPLQTVNGRSCMFTAVGVMASGVKRDRKLLHLYSSVAAYLDWIEATAFAGELEEIAEELTSTSTTTTTTTTTTVRPTSEAWTWKYTRDFFFPDGLLNE